MSIGKARARLSELVCQSRGDEVVSVNHSRVAAITQRTEWITPREAR